MVIVEVVTIHDCPLSTRPALHSFQINHASKSFHVQAGTQMERVCIAVGLSCYSF